VSVLFGFPLPRTAPIEWSSRGASVVPVVDLVVPVVDLVPFAGIVALWLVQITEVKQVLCSHIFLTLVHDAKSVWMAPCLLCIRSPKVSECSLPELMSR
jgi:hypothetical protein